jgi:endonuclease/exonuclease/phosphatase family metal-dependent hydrolase
MGTVFSYARVIVVAAAIGGWLAGGAGSVSAAPPAKPWDGLLIASFNIQVFGESKMAKTNVVEVLARVVRAFDIVAVQEVRAKSDSIVPEFVRMVNANGSRYHYVIGPRQGRTVSKEQYTFIYDTDRVEVDPSSVGVVPDPGGRLHRPPMHARFRTRVVPVELAFTFWLVDIHTDPDEVPQELDALTDVFRAMQVARPDEDDVILLGDLNAGPPQFSPLQRIPGIGWAVAGVTTNTRRTKTYDNLVFARPATTEYLGLWGVMDLQSTFGLPLDHALEVSDHNPVWAAFYPCESRPVAGGVAGTVPLRR